MMNRQIKFIYAIIIIAVIGISLTFLIIKYNEKYIQTMGSSQSAEPEVATANQKLDKLWKSFSYKGNPVHPKCFDSLLSVEDNLDKIVINLDSCSVYDLNKEKVDGNFIKELYFEYNIPQDKDGYTTGYIWYKPIAKSGDTYYINYGENSGGTGQFTSILSMQKVGNKLTHIKYVSDMGDRCNGGVGGVPADTLANSFLYNINLTPSDILDYIDPKNSEKAYINLESSAASCFGKLYLRYDLLSNKSSFEYIDIDTEIDLDSNKDWSDNYTHQSCFNQLYGSYVKRGDTKLDNDKLKLFHKEFMDVCVNNS